jgi:sugar/nucleoside kinase (ribokinase family)
MNSDGLIKKVAGILEREKETDKSAFLGFDACIDNIVRVVRGKNESGEPLFFETGRQFADFIIARNDKSCGIELDTRVSKLGGNMVITANALGTLGVTSECAGTFGIPEILPFFRSMSSNCTLHTIGDTITATALEFSANKVILFDPGPYTRLNWISILGILGKDKITGMMKGKDLVSFLNWSEIERSSDIWEGFLTDIIPLLPFAPSKNIFFTDFSDCSRKSHEEILRALQLLGRFRKYFKVVLSLNHNEADLVASALGIKHRGSDEMFIQGLHKVSGTDILVIHRTEDALASDGRSVATEKTFLCKDPVLLTGGGDNFNAGFCLAQLLGMDLPQSLITANAVSGFYVKYGVSPGRKQLGDFLKSVL